jgi:hypothetical protein
MMLQFRNSPLVLYKMVGHTNSEMIYKNYARFMKQEVAKKILKIFEVNFGYNYKQFLTINYNCQQFEDVLKALILKGLIVKELILLR